MNPYQRLLYDHLRGEGFELEPEARFTLRWLAQRPRPGRRAPPALARGALPFQRGPAVLRPLGSRAKLVLFAARLAFARALGYRIVWTVHQVYPHGSRGRGRRPARRARARTRRARPDRPRRDDPRTRGGALGPRAAARLAVVPHASYVGVYPPGRPRATVRRELGLDAAAFVFLCFGELRAHKSWRLVVEAFRATTNPDAALVLAGMVRSPAVRHAIVAATADDPRIRLLLRFVDDAEVARALRRRRRGRDRARRRRHVRLPPPAALARRARRRRRPARLPGRGRSRRRRLAVRPGRRVGRSPRRSQQAAADPARGAAPGRRGAPARPPPPLGRRRRADREAAPRGRRVSGEATAVLDRLPVAAGVERAAADEPAADHAPCRGPRARGALRRDRPLRRLAGSAARPRAGRAARSPGACSPPSRWRPGSRP